MNSLSLLFLLSQVFIRISLTNAATHCSSTAGNFTKQSSYAQNLNLTLSLLPSNTSSANGLFYTSSIGQDPNQVHVLSLCRADSTPSDCTDCLNLVIEEMRDFCPYQKEAYSWQGSPPCLVRYSNRSIIGELELSPTDPGYNTGNVTTNMEQFDKTWESLMERVLAKASSGSSTLKFATGNVQLNVFQKIYTIMQCTPDLTQDDCGDCLRGVVSSYQDCCHGKQGGYVHKPSCFFRWDLYPFYNSSLDAASPSPSPSPSSIIPRNITNPTVRENGQLSILFLTLIVVITSSIIIAIFVFSYFLFVRRKNKGNVQEGDEIICTVDSLQFDFGTIRAATNDFSDDNKLGQGGFGVVYKGRLSNGQEIAVKRLSKNSGQGAVEFKNEVMLLARLEHRNLVRLLGFCLEKEERLLIYELLKNSSLDNYIFDPTSRRAELDWEKRYKIIGGIARGLVYLHEDSRLRIIHRDLKASNILLDAGMNAKISDFGMARMFEADQTQADTRRVVGTIGYMPPEYAIHGRFSVKTDVFSFGVLVLEIICGQKNKDFQNGENGDGLIIHAWKSWNEGKAIDLIDPALRGIGSRSEMMRCIHIGLLCVQQHVDDRPTMASVLLMLSSDTITLEVPSKPPFLMISNIQHDTTSGSDYYANEASFLVEGRD